MTRSFISFSLVAAIAVGVAFAQSAAAPKVIILIGPPGSGKTTQARFLAQKYGIPAFSMADLLKKEMATRQKDAISKSLAASIAGGDILPDDAATDLIKQRLFSTDLRHGFVLDGYPATGGQAKSLDRMLHEQSLPKPVVVLLDAPDDVIRKRMLARRRADDKPENIERRIREYRSEAETLAAWAGQTHFVRVDGTASIAAMSTQIIAGLEDASSKQRPAP